MTNRSIQESNIEETTLAKFGSSGPRITTIQYANASMVATQTNTANIGDPFYVIINGTGFQMSSLVIVGKIQANYTTFISSTQVFAQIPSLPLGKHTVYVQNGDGTTAIKVDALNYGIAPVPDFGSLILRDKIVNYPFSDRFTAIALEDLTWSADANNGTLLPANTSLAANGYFYGVANTVGTNYFYINATSSGQTVTSLIQATINTGDSDYYRTGMHVVSREGPGFSDDFSDYSHTFKTFGDTRPTSFHPLGENWSYLFIGAAGNYLTLPNSPVFNSLGTLNWTIEGWFFTGSTALQNLVYIGGSATSFAAIRIDKTATNTIQVLCSLNGTSHAINFSSTAITLGVWNHIALCRSGTSVYLWINGVQGGATTTLTGSLAAGTLTRIGALGNAAQIYSGLISNLRLVKGTALYTAAFTPPTKNLTNITNTALLIGVTNSRTDISDNNIAISVVGDIPIRPTGPYGNNLSEPIINPETAISYFFDTGANYLSNNTIGVTNFSTGDFTVEYWIYPLLKTTGAAFYNHVGTPSSAAGIGFGQYNRTFSATTSTVGYTSTVGVNFDEWQHIAWVRTSGTLKLYKNGVLGYSVALTTNLTVAGIGIGAQKTGTNAMLPGYIADIRVNKLEPIYTSNFTPPAAPADPTQFLTVTGTTFTDISNNSFGITAVGDTTPAPFIPYGTNWSGFFDGTGDYLTVMGTTALNFGTGDFTIEVWAYQPNITAGTRCIVTLSPYATGNTGWTLYSGAGYLAWFVSGANRIVTTAFMPAGTWNHVAVVRSSGTTKIYLNGTVSGTPYTDATNYSGTSQIVGSDGTQHFSGYLSNLRIIKGTAVYTAAFTPPTTPLTAVANTSLLILQDNKFIDKSTNAHAITQFGNAAITQFGPFTPYSPDGKSGYFDGTGDYLTVPDNASFEMDGDFTVEAWFYMTATPGAGLFGNIISKGAAGIYQPYYIFVNSSNALLFYSSSNGTTWDVASAISFGTIKVNNWYHVVVSRQGTSMRLFLNGSLITTITNGNALFNNTRAVAIGARSDGTETFTGYINDVRIVKGTAVYTEAFTPPTTPLTSIEGTSLLTLYNFTPSTQTLLNIGDDKTFTRTGKIGTHNFGPYGNYKPADTTKSSYFFDGLINEVTLDDNPGFDLTGDFTFEAWIYPTINGGNRTIISVWQTGSLNFIFRTQGNYVAMYIYPGTTIGVVGTTALITLYKWQHVAATRTSGIMRVFVDGVLDTTTVTNTGVTSGTVRPRIGSITPGSATEVFYGNISNLRILNGTSLYTTSFKRPSLPLKAIANTVLLTAQDSSYIDRSNSNSSFVISGNTSIVSFSPYVESDSIFTYDSSRVGSTYFDGTGDYMLADPGNSDAFDLPGDFTWECWVYYTGTFAAASVIYDTVALSEATGAGRFRITIETTGRITGNTNVSTSFYSSEVGVIVKNSWTHILIARSGTTVTGYINGTQSGPTVTNSTNFITNPNRPAIGSAGGTIGTHMIGYLYNLRVLKGRARWTANTSKPTSPLSYNDANTALLTLSTYDSENNRKIVDKSRNSSLPTIVGNPMVGSFNPYGPTEYSVNFLNSWINLAAPAALAFGSSNFTIEMRVNFTTISADAIFYDARPVSTNGLYPVVGFGSATKKFRYYVSTADRILSDVIVESNRWYHLVVSRSGGVTRMFVDGVEQTSTYTDANVYLLGASRPIIGADGFNTASGNFRGYMYDLRVLVGTGVTSVTVPTAPLDNIANTRLLMCKSNRIFDYSNANYALTVTGTGAKVIPFSPYKSSTVYQPDIHGASMEFGGSGYITMPYYKELYDWWLSDYTIECWVNLTAFSSDAGGQIVGCMNPSTATKYWNLGVGNTGSVVFYYFTTAGVLLNSGKVLKLKEWNHIAVTHKLGSGIRIWVNGQAGPVTAVSGTPTTIVSQVLSIGGYNNVRYNGYISNLRLTKEVMYSGNTAAPTSPVKLTANTIMMMDFDTGAIIDYTTRHNIITTGDVRVLHAPTRANTEWNDYRNRYTNTAIYFDGTGDYLSTTTALSQTEILATGDWCIEFWVNREVSGVQHTIYDQRSATTQVVPHIYISTGNSIVYYVNGVDRIVSNTITSNTWYNVVIERYSGNTSMYLNGTRTGGIYADTNVYVLNNNLFGAAPSVGTPFRGYLQDFRITLASRYGANSINQITQSYPLGY